MLPAFFKGQAYFAVGIANSAPLPMLAGQRCMTDFCLVYMGAGANVLSFGRFQNAEDFAVALA